MASLLREFRVVNLYETSPGVRIGIARTTVVRNALSINIEIVKNVARYAGKIGIKTLILPPFLPLGASSRDITSDEVIDSLSINSRNPFVRIIRQIATSYSINIIAPYVIESSRGRYYISNLFISGSTSILRFFSRKILLSDHEEKVGFTNGSMVDLVGDNYLVYSALIDQDSMFPELARLISYTGGDLLLAIHSDISDSDLLKKHVVSTYMTTGLPIVYLGYILMDGEITRSMPTIVALSESEVYEFSDARSYLITIPTKYVKQAVRRANPRHAGVVLGLISRYHRRVRVFKG